MPGSILSADGYLPGIHSLDQYTHLKSTAILNHGEMEVSTIVQYVSGVMAFSLACSRSLGYGDCGLCWTLAQE